MAFPTWPATTAPPAKTIGLNAFWPWDRKPRPAARSACVATRYRFILVRRQSKAVARNNLHTHLNRRKRKNGALTKMNHHPAKLSSLGAVAVMCQLEAPLINNSVLKRKDGRNAATINKVSGRTRSRKRLFLSIRASKEESSFSPTNPDLR